jgi:hypothetical protein
MVKSPFTDFFESSNVSYIGDPRKTFSAQQTPDLERITDLFRSALSAMRTMPLAWSLLRSLGVIE